MNNNERFNELLNSCENPHAVMAALLALAECGFFQKERKEDNAA